MSKKKEIKYFRGYSQIADDEIDIPGNTDVESISDDTQGKTGKLKDLGLGEYLITDTAVREKFDIPEDEDFVYNASSYSYDNKTWHEPSVVIEVKVTLNAEKKFIEHSNAELKKLLEKDGWVKLKSTEYENMITGCITKVTKIYDDEIQYKTHEF